MHHSESDSQQRCAIEHPADCTGSGMECDDLSSLSIGGTCSVGLTRLLGRPCSKRGKQVAKKKSGNPAVAQDRTPYRNEVRQRQSLNLNDHWNKNSVMECRLSPADVRNRAPARARAGPSGGAGTAPITRFRVGRGSKVSRCTDPTHFSLVQLPLIMFLFAQTVQVEAGKLFSLEKALLCNNVLIKWLDI